MIRASIVHAVDIVFSANSSTVSSILPQTTVCFAAVFGDVAQRSPVETKRKWMLDNVRAACSRFFIAWHPKNGCKRRHLACMFVSVAKPRGDWWIVELKIYENCNSRESCQLKSGYREDYYCQSQCIAWLFIKKHHPRMDNNTYNQALSTVHEI